MRRAEPREDALEDDAGLREGDATAGASSSITMYGVLSSAVPTSNTRTMFGWMRRWHVTPSSMKRFLMSASSR
jgi:hypothetical protein